MRRVLGFIDSGLGGLTLLKELLVLNPALSYTYLADNKNFPYGEKSPAELTRLVLDRARYLVEQEGVVSLALACHSASALALSELKSNLGVPLFEMVTPSVAAVVEKTAVGRVGVLATQATANSEAYQRAFAAVGVEAHVVACPPFAKLAEEGVAGRSPSSSFALRYLEPLHAAGIDTLLLACTHYPLLGELWPATWPAIAIIDGAKAAAHSFNESFERMSLIGEPRLLATADAETYQIRVQSRFSDLPQALPA